MPKSRTDNDLITDTGTNLTVNGQFVKVPYLLGTNQDEGTAFGVRGINTDQQFLNMVTSTGVDNATAAVVAIVYPNIPEIGIPETIVGKPPATPAYVLGKIEALEELIRNELLPRIGTTPTANALSSPLPSSSPPPSIAPGQIPDIGLDLSRVAIPEIKEGNAGTARRRVNEALKGKGINCLGVNSKGNGRYRLLFHGDDVDKVRRVDTWLRTHFDREMLYGKQWYPMRVDRVYHEVATDEVGCVLFGRLNGVKVHKMRWLGNVSVDKEYRSMVVYLETKGEVDRLLAKMTVTMANGECAYTRPFVIGRQPARCYRCHLYGHLPYRCRAPAPVCGQCALPGHAASTCTSMTFKCGVWWKERPQGKGFGVSSISTGARQVTTVTIAFVRLTLSILAYFNPAQSLYLPHVVARGWVG
ncbi:hypothetical protein IFR05_001677 [Cadophora sp. M221]|nr:hypothetical protein IFR05_001677 [Cadophora sp. M221]